MIFEESSIREGHITEQICVQYTVRLNFVKAAELKDIISTWNLKWQSFPHWKGHSKERFFRLLIGAFSQIVICYTANRLHGR